MRKETEEKLYDVRLLQRNIYLGKLTPKDLNNYLKTLEDSGNNAEEIQLEEAAEEDASDNEEIKSSEEPESDIYKDDITL